MKLGTLRNPKFLRLARMLGHGKAAAAGHLEALWHFTSDQAPAGDIGRWDDEDIEEGCLWEGGSGVLIAALIECGWVDRCQNHRLVVHDWAEHASAMVKKRNGRAGIEFAALVPLEGHGAEREPDGIHPDAGRPTTSPHQSPPHPTTASGAGGAPSVSRSVPSAKSTCPDRLDPPQREALLAWARDRGFSESQCRWAFNAVKDWSRSKHERRADWVATTRNAMRDGWALKGYRETDAERYAREMAESPFKILTGGTDDAA